MARDGEHFIMCFLVICTSSFEKSLFSSFANFFYWFIDFLAVSFFELPCIFWLSVPCLEKA
jgi:hypothetical protein